MATAPPSRITATLDLRATALLACEGLAQSLLSGDYTVRCLEYDASKAVTPPRRALKLAASALAARQLAAALPFVLTPEALLDGMLKLGFPENVANEAVAQVTVAYGLKSAAESHADDYACEILTGHLSAVPHLAGGIRSIEPTTKTKVEPVLSLKQQREAAGLDAPENPVGPLGSLPNLDTARRAAEEGGLS